MCIRDNYNTTGDTGMMGVDSVKIASLIKFNVKLDGVEMLAAVDSGSQYCLIGKKELGKIPNPTVISKEMRLRGLGDPQQSVESHQTVILEVTIDGIKYGQLEFLVLEDLKEGVMLGMPFLVGNSIKFDIRDGSIRRYGDNGVREQVYVMGGTENCIRTVTRIPVHTTETIVIDKNNWVPVKVKWKSKLVKPRSKERQYRAKPEELLVEGREDCKRGYNHRFKVLPGLVKWNEEEGTVLLKKLIPGSLKLNTGEQIGIAHLLVDEDKLRKYGVTTCTVNTTVREVIERGDEQEWTKEKLKDEIKFMEELHSGQIEQVLEVLWKNKMAFSRSDADVSQTAMTPYKIRLHDYTPIYQRARRFDQKTNQEIEQQVEELCMKDIAEPCAAEWSSPVVPIRKKDGTLRLCVDYRRLNQVTEADKFPMANIQETIYACHGVRYFTSMDLVKGYYQMNLAEDSRDFTAFSTVSGQNRFKRLSFGLKNGPAAFQREMQRIMTGFSKDKVVVYLDDVLLMSKSFEEHLLLIDLSLIHIS